MGVVYSIKINSTKGKHEVRLKDIQSHFQIGIISNLRML